MNKSRKHHKTSEEWIGLKFSGWTVVEKIGEKTLPRKNRNDEVFDLLRIQCDCGHLKEIVSCTLVKNNGAFCKACDQRPRIVKNKRESTLKLESSIFAKSKISLIR